MKKYIKVAFIAFITIAVIGSQTNLSVFALTGENDVTNSEENVEASMGNAEPQTEEEQQSASEAEDNSEAAGVLGSGLVVTPFSTAGFAVFDGVDLSVTNDITISGSATAVAPKTLIVKSTFPTDATITERKLQIKINNVLALQGAHGMVADNVKLWKFDSSKLPAELQGIVMNATFTPDPLVNGVYPKTGVLEYEFSPGTESATIELQLGINQSYALGFINNAVTKNDPIEINTTYLDNGILKDKDNSKINSITLSAGSTANIAFVTNSALGTIPQQKLAGESGAGIYYFDAYIGSIYDKTVVYEKIEYVIEVPKALGFQSVSSTKYDINYSVDTISSTTVDVVTIQFNNNPRPSSTPSKDIAINYTIPNDAAVGTYILAKSRSVAVTLLDGSVVTKTTPSLTGLTVNILAERDENLSIKVATQNYAFQNLNTSGTLLGSYQLVNETPDTLSSQIGRLDFTNSAGVVGVEYIILQAQTGVKVENIVAKTNLGNTYTLSQAQLFGANYHHINKDNLGITDSDEYISELTWEYNGSFNAGWGSSDNYAYLYTSSVRYYGKVLNIPASKTYKSTLTIGKKETGFEDPTVSKKEGTINIVDTNIGRAVIHVGSNLNTSVISGNAYQAALDFSLSNNTVNGAARINNLEGISVYLREGDYLLIDKSTLNVTWNGQTYSVANGTLSVTEIIDNTNNKVYRIDLPDVVLGVDPDTNTNLRANVTYKVTPKKTAPTTAIVLNELVQVKPYDSNIGAAPDGYQGIRNIFNVTGSGDLTEPLSSANNNQSLKIQAQKAFVVTTAANLNNGPWVTYDYDTQKSIIDLNPEGDAKYQLAVANNSGQTITGYTALIPIPKAGEATDLIPGTPGAFDPSVHLQKEAFTWTASVLSEVDTSSAGLNYTVLYATTYETDKDSAAFVPWSAITNKDDIRMVKIITNDPIVDGTSDVITFPLALTDTDADLHAGLTNIYSARIYRSVDGNAGYKPSEPIAIRLKTGVVKGQVFNDTNRNGLKDTGETGRNGVTVVALEAGTTTVIETTTTKTIDGVDGSYAFLGLDKAQNVDIVFTNPVTDDTIRFSPVTSGGSTPTATATHDKATTSNLTPSAIGFDTINAGLIAPTTVSMNAGTGGSTATATFTRFPGEAITTEPEAVKTGYTFTGWFTAATGGSKVTFPYTVGTMDVMLYAQYTANKYVLSYDVATNGATSTKPADEQVTYDTVATAPADAVKTGYTFTGWFDAATGGTQWNFATSKMPANDMKLYAQFTINSYTMTFDNDAVTTTQTVVYDTLVTEPTAPIKTGFTFVGWFDAQTGGTKWNFATNKMPASNKTLYAQYTRNNYTLTFNDQGTTSTQTVAFDALAVEPATVPTKSGYTFSGWFDAATGGTKWNFATNKMPASNKTLYAQFTADDQNITFDANGGTGAPATLTQPTDSSVNLDALTNPTRAGYTFVGWLR
ncbi:hypothetical protein FEZ08_11575 [Culicoidibacter larvae]|uniref:Uncharacterized protein n=1 Tax=Culicoidibacter larvae TaxID=2579976 RepID=A0A5R8Q6X0_9FIRM|nr:InlB B-repeat-containing protein [Culicoidibacter larvae]TLG71093.1 hypothetical protein FEZ08_11575 [Culicoidibacter larvae]